MSAPIDAKAIGSILDVIASFFAESGCPLTPEQVEALTNGPRAEVERIKAAA